MTDRLDMLILGATGFTGKHCIAPIAKLSKAHGRNLTWGVAGRSESKLKDVLDEVGKEIGQDLSKIPLVIADIHDDDSLKSMAEKTKCVINCCGPYRFLGEAVVKACIAAGTHHVDVSGEPQYMEKVQLEQSEEAEKKGVYVVSACGFDSIPSDLGVVFLEQKFEGTLNSVETYLKRWEEGEVAASGPAGNYGTWHSAVYGLAHAAELKTIRRMLYPERLPKFEPQLQHTALPHKVDLEPGWALPFPGSDKSVVRRTQRYFYDTNSKRPVQVDTYFMVDSIWIVLLMAFFGSIFVLLTKFKWGIQLLLKYPGLFSGGLFGTENPSEEKISKYWFSITFRGKGWKGDKQDGPENREIVGRVKGRNPAYGTTCIALVLSAIMILTEKNKLPPKGGVYPPGALFAKTTLINELNENEVTFEILSQKDI
ncbi:saccharopine dehydrogenase-like oxidoreductase isoform X2 [Aethina tumida]|nr:saccharopine dehydrogenase-like oxidoreductase isoform X2 [Aethina tumida]